MVKKVDFCGIRNPRPRRRPLLDVQWAPARRTLALRFAAIQKLYGFGNVARITGETVLRSTPAHINSKFFSKNLFLQKCHADFMQWILALIR